MTYRKKNVLETEEGASLLIVQPLLSYTEQTIILDIAMQLYTFKPFKSV